MRSFTKAGGLVLLLSSLARAQDATPPPAPLPETVVPPGDASKPRASLERIPDTVKLFPVEIPYVHPLYREIETPAKIVEVAAPTDYEGPASLVVAVKIDGEGKVLDAQAVEPPVRGLANSIPALFPKWKFIGARKNIQPMGTWVSIAFELEIQVEKGAITSAALAPVGRDEPLPQLVPERVGEEWIARYPKSLEPPEPGFISIEEVSVLPSPDKVKWDFDASKQSTRVTALVRISELGQVTRFVPTGELDPFLVTWVRGATARWKVTPATLKGRPVESWATFSATLSYTLDNAKQKSLRSIKKNLRGTPKNL